MGDAKRKRFESAVAGLQQRWGPRALVPARAVEARPAVIPTGFAELDAALNIGGVPLNALVLLSGHTTSGKLTLAYKILGQAQRQARRHSVAAIVDLNRSSDPDYMARCGIELDDLLLIRPSAGKQAIDLLLDLVRSHQTRAILIDSLADLLVDANTGRYLAAVFPQLHQLLTNANCALLFLDEPRPVWRRWLRGHWSHAVAQAAALHIDLQREWWLEEADELRGYQARAQIIRNRWGRSGQAVSIAIEFNGTVRARDTW